MGHMMISLTKKQEQLARQLAKEIHGPQKGALSATFAEALEALVEKRNREKSVERALARLRKGFEGGLGSRKAYESRDEIYERARAGGL